MTDIHTHILPGVDDGAADPEQSLAMLRMEGEQGVERVVLTPHFYIKHESADRFLARRQEGWQRLEERLAWLEPEERSGLPDLVLGAEVAWQASVLDCPQLDSLCMGRSRYMLVELPFDRWTGQTIRQLNELMGFHGITPVLAHLERYLDIQDPKLIRQLLDLDVPVQISCAVLNSFWQGRKAVKLLRSGQAQLVASDCHNCDTRPPDMARGIEQLRRKVGREAADRALLLGNDLLT